MPRKWRVTVVCSSYSPSPASLTSLHNALYLSLCLQSTNMADITLVSEIKYNAPTLNLHYIPPKSKVITKTTQSIDTCALSDIISIDSDLILFMAAPGDMEHLSAAFLSAISGNSKKMLIFNILRSIGEDSILNSTLADLKDIIIMNCHLGSDVVMLNDVLTPFIDGAGSLTIERLTKENVKDMDMAARLMESSKISVLYRKGVPRHSWGVVLYEQLYLINALNEGETLSKTLSDYRFRRASAHMLHEAHKCLLEAGKRGDWTPTLFSLTYLDPLAIEFILLLPNILFRVVCLFGLFPISYKHSTIQDSITTRRNFCGKWNVEKLLKTAETYSVKMPHTQAVFNRLIELERLGYAENSREKACAICNEQVPSSYTLYKRFISKRTEAYAIRFFIAVLIVIVAIIIPFVI